ncbi:MAG TPA: hypothetical protein PKL15_10590 [Saprospiraceae bacterium]|nr:hypothetical protein [Saprospiraceae bacterium]
MKNFLFALITLHTTISLALLAARCGHSPVPAAQPTPPAQRALAIGVDRSSSIAEYPYSILDTSHLRRLCEPLLDSPQGALVAFDIIGSPNQAKIIRLYIKPTRQKTPPRTLTLPEQQQRNRERTQIRQDNRDSLEVFLQRCQRRLDAPVQSETDLNGFFAKMNVLLSEPGYTAFEKTLYVETDGFQYVKGEQKGSILRDLNCPELPANCRFYTGHWSPNAAKCGQVKAEFEDIEGFISFFNQSQN